MRTIKNFDSQNYEPHWQTYKRDSARAIIFCNENSEHNKKLHNKKLAMIKSEKYGEYKFPGGGIDAGETHIDALLREVREETGLHVLPDSIREYGRTLILRKGMGDNEIFEQESFYYTCAVDDKKSSVPKPDAGYETEYGYRLVYASLDEAIDTNEELQNAPGIPDFIIGQIKRELAVLHELRGKKGHDCIGCALANGTIIPTGGIIKETENFILHQDPDVPIKGFLIIASKQHVKSIADFSKNQAAEFFELTYDARKALLTFDDILECCLIQEERSKHFHFWIFPRYEWMNEYFENSLSTMRAIMKHAKENLNTAENIADVEKRAAQLRTILQI